MEHGRMPKIFEADGYRAPGRNSRYRGATLNLPKVMVGSD
jgi:hypothetical protein